MCKDKICQCPSGFTGDPFVSCTGNQVLQNNQTPSIKCPTNSSGYYLVGNKCIYFEQTDLNWENAKKGCKNKFSGGGRLFEPLSLQEHNDVYALIKIYNKNFNVAYWIGVDDLSQEGSFTYSSSGSKISFNLPWHDNNRAPWGTRGSKYNCVLVNNDGLSATSGDLRGLWADADCPIPIPSVCEPE